MLNKIRSFLKVDQFVENITGYFEARIELAKLDFKKELASVLAKIVVFSVAIFGAMGMFLSISLALGFWFNQLLDSNYAGFFVLSFFYTGIAALGLYAAKNENLISSLRNSFERQLFSEDININQNGNQDTNTDNDG